MLKLRSFITGEKFLITILILLSFVISIQNIQLGPKKFNDLLPPYPTYNNYIIFKQSFFHLLEEKNLYLQYTLEHWDLFKYTPTFALAFGALAWMPDWLGMFLWHAINALVLFAGIRSLPVLSEKQKNLAMWLAVIELVTSLQNQQSNALLAGLLLLGFSSLEKNRPLRFAFAVMAAAFIKPFALAVLPMCLFYGRRAKLTLSLGASTVFYALLPLLVIRPSNYAMQISAYADMLRHDHDISLGYSVMALVQALLKTVVDKASFVFAGGVLLLVPLTFVQRYGIFRFRFLWFLSVLIWMVIFNHKSESPSFVIAMTAASLWICYEPAKSWRYVLFIFAFILTGLSPTDVFPKTWREEYVHPYALKSLPCLLIWLALSLELLFFRKQDRETFAAAN